MTTNLSVLLISLALLAFTSCVISENGAWVKVTTNDATWQADCGHSRRVGAVCVNAQYGQRDQYRVQINARQNVVFSGDGRKFVAYCPNTDKNENTYTITYGTGSNPARFHILGRPSNRECCTVNYTPSDGSFVPLMCISPAVLFNTAFPENPEQGHSPKNPPFSHDDEGKRA